MTDDQRNDYLQDPAARGFVRTALTFGLGIGLGLAPFLGEIQIPGFRPLLQVLPTNLIDFLLAVAPLLMGLVAAAVRFYFRDRLSLKKLERLLWISLSGAALGLLALVYIHNFYVCPVTMGPGEGKRLVIISLDRLPDCTCGASGRVSDEDCIKGLAFDLDRCWDKRVRKNVAFVFELVYLVVNFSFGVVVGVLVLRREKETVKRTRRKTSRASGKPPGAKRGQATSRNAPSDGAP